MRSAVKSLRGNARACVFTEPLFMIPHTMYTGFMTLYMLELGVTKPQVGMITSLGLAVSIFLAFISAYLTDKIGRRYSTFIFDAIGWGLAQLVWAIAGNIYFFIAAAIVNSFGRVVMNSWHCLMLEDSPPEVRVHIFSFLQFAGVLGGFFTPIGALLISRLSLVPAMRVMLTFGFVSMMVLFFVRHAFVTETTIGKQKIEEMRGVSIRSVFSAFIPVLKSMSKDRLLTIALVVRSLNFIQFTIRNTFVAVLITERLGFPAESIAIFQTFISVAMLVSLIFFTPLLSRFTSRWPISLGICFHIGATVLLLISPPTQNYPLLILCALFIALGTSVATPRIDALLANAISNEDRSTVNAVASVVLLVLSTPFGLIAGVLSDIDPRMPFLLTGSIFIASLLLLRYASRIKS